MSYRTLFAVSHQSALSAIALLLLAMQSQVYAVTPIMLPVRDAIRCTMVVRDDTLRISLQNTSSLTFSIMRRGTPLEGFLGDHLIVEHDGQRKDYIGPMVKRSAPVASEYWLMKGKSKREITLPLLRGYDVSARGKYRAHWNGELMDARIGAVKTFVAEHVQPATLSCSAVVFQR
jgi:hypothetical protein